MLRSFPPMLGALIALAIAAGSARGDTVGLRSGGTIVGTVRLSGTDRVVIDSVFPETKTVLLMREDIAPESMHDILERLAEPGDAAKRRELGEFAEAHGLVALAIADFTLVKKLDPATAKAMDPRISRLNEALADEILADAQDLLDAGNPNAALMYLGTLASRFPRTGAAKRAEPVATAAADSALAFSRVVEPSVAATEVPRVVAEAEANLAKGDAARGTPSSRTGKGVVADGRAAARAVACYEAASRAARSIPSAPSGDSALDARVERVRSASRSKLIEAYLATGTILLERRAISGAEDCSNRLCALDPSNENGRELHERVVAAKALGYRAPNGASR